MIGQDTVNTDSLSELVAEGEVEHVQDQDSSADGVE